MIENEFSVSKRQWKKWTGDGRRVFNDLYSFSVTSQSLFTHPLAPLVNPDHWKTVAWNHAWMAADFVSRSQKGK